MPAGFLVIAHRGASRTAPENTLAAIREAVAAGADMIELDVQMTRDERLVVCHDRRLDRTTNGTGPIDLKSYAQIARLDAGAWFGQRFFGLRVPLLSQALAAIPPPIGINLEIKPRGDPDRLLLRLKRVIARARVRDRLLVSSNSPLVVEKAACLRLPRALVWRREGDGEPETAARLGCAAWNPRHDRLTERLATRARKLGLAVYPWSVDDEEVLDRMLALRVSGAFTNDPAWLLAVLARRRGVPAGA